MNNWIANLKSDYIIINISHTEALNICSNNALYNYQVNTMPDKDELKSKILAEMLADHSDALEKNYPLAKEFVRITKEGKVDVLVKDKVSGMDKIALYLIGKRYAHRAGLASSEYVKNAELCSELGVVQNSLLPWLKWLRDGRIVEQGAREGNETSHAIALNAVERTLKTVSAKLKSKQGSGAEEGQAAANASTGE